jgi:hypothetical protein
MGCLALRIRLPELGVGRYVLPDTLELTTVVHLVRYDGLDFCLGRDDGIYADARCKIQDSKDPLLDIYSSPDAHSALRMDIAPVASG